MTMNSPWIEELDEKRAVSVFNSSQKTEICVVGGGISGMVTSYFLLKDTKYAVTLLEASRIAHGASGHNAGQVAQYFEKPYTEIVKEYGLELAAKGQQALVDAYVHLKEILEYTKIPVPIYEFIGYLGCSAVDQIIQHLNNKHLRNLDHLQIESVLVLDDPEIKKQIPAAYFEYIKFVSHDKILSVLQTEDSQYIAAFSSHKATVNSALFVEQLAKWLLHKYPKRFSLFEQSPVQKIFLHDHRAELSIKNFSGKYILKTNKVILATNGFEGFDIMNVQGSAIDKRFHEMVSGVVGYMAGFTDAPPSLPTAMSYFPSEGKIQTEHDSEAYYYVTKRPYERNTHKTLICIGGPEKPLTADLRYDPWDHTQPEIYESVRNFVNKTIKNTHCQKFRYQWHGLMGYTNTGLRVIGPDKVNPVLMYNLGCNGVGILSSIHGGRKTAQYINHQVHEKSIFDPQ